MCSYCGCQSISTIGRLMAEHVEVINATGDLRRACEAADGASVGRRAGRVAGLLHPHTVMEEVGLFAVMSEQEEYADHIHRLCGEHTLLDELLAAVAAGDLAGISAFEHALREHIDKEDNGLFPAAAIALSGADWDRVEAAATPPTHPHDHSHGPGHDDHEHEHEHEHLHVHPGATGEIRPPAG